MTKARIRVGRGKEGNGWRFFVLVFEIYFMSRSQPPPSSFPSPILTNPSPTSSSPSPEISGAPSPTLGHLVSALVTSSPTETQPGGGKGIQWQEAETKVALLHLLGYPHDDQAVHCYKYIGDLGQAPVCSLVGGLGFVRPCGPRLVDSVVLLVVSLTPPTCSFKTPTLPQGSTWWSLYLPPSATGWRLSGDIYARFLSASIA